MESPPVLLSQFQLMFSLTEGENGKHSADSRFHQKHVWINLDGMKETIKSVHFKTSRRKACHMSNTDYNY